MRCVLQRASSASVTVDGRVVGEIGRGLVVLAAIGPTDGEDELAWMARKVARLRIFDDEQGRFDCSVGDVGGAVLSISQFTLYADSSRGTRPSFAGAAGPDLAEPAWERFNELLEAEGIPVQVGRFGARMHVELVNDGPVTVVLEREPQRG